jgi:hypothetical protein
MKTVELYVFLNGEKIYIGDFETLAGAHDHLETIPGNSWDSAETYNRAIKSRMQWEKVVSD